MFMKQNHCFINKTIDSKVVRKYRNPSFLSEKMELRNPETFSY